MKYHHWHKQAIQVVLQERHKRTTKTTEPRTRIIIINHPHSLVVGED